MTSLALNSRLEERRQRLGDQLAVFRRIMRAVLIQDMRTRFGNNHIGYLLAIAWPLAHISIITLAYLVRISVAPIGDSPTIFVGTAIVPYILCFYPARMLAQAIQQNRQLLNIPVIQPVHLIFGRCILETVNAVIVLAVFIFAVSLFDVDILPTDVAEASKVIGAAVFLGIGLGILNVVMGAILGRYFLTFFTLSMAGLYVTSGAYFPPDAIPPYVREYLVYNPLAQLIEWMRSAYYASYDPELINKPLIYWVGGISLVLGLVGERFLRGKIFS